METRRLLMNVVILVMLVCMLLAGRAGAVGTAFTYQGRLVDANSPAEGLYDFEFAIFDDATEGSQLGSTIDVNDLDVIEGYFTTSLDFGGDPNIFSGVPHWLEIAVRPGTSSDANDFAMLSPRQELTPAPYAIYSETAGSIEDGISWSEVSDRPAGLDDGDDVGITSESDPQVGSNTTNYIPKWNGSELVTGSIFDNGNVGIGTSSPSGPFDVAIATGGPSGSPVLDQSQTTYNFYKSDSSLWQSFTPGLTGDLTSITLYTQGANWICPIFCFYGPSNGTLNIYEGEGVSGTLLASQAIIIDTPTWAVTNYPLSDPPYVGSGVKYTFQIIINPGQNDREWIRYNAIGPYPDGTLNGGGGDLYFQTYVDPYIVTGTDSSLMVDVDGNVGIGTETPSTKLDVDGTVNATAFVGDGSGLTGIATEDSDWQISGDNMYSIPIGNVGIGTTSPAERLSIGGAGSGIELGAGVAKEVNAGKILYQVYSDALDIIGAGTTAGNRKIQFYNEGGASFSGNVGIGTTSPSTKLDVVGTINATAFTGDGSGLTNLPPGSGEIDPTVLASVKDGVDWSEVTSRPTGLDDGDDDTQLSEAQVDSYVANNGYLTSYTETDPQVGVVDTNSVPKWDGSALVTGTIYDNGNIGIGTTSPSSKLDVVGATELNGNVDINSDLDVDAGTLHVDGTSNRVGIGTTIPSDKLDVDGTVKATSFNGVPWRSPMWMITNSSTNVLGYFPPAGNWPYYRFMMPFNVTIEGFVVSVDDEGNNASFSFSLFINQDVTADRTTSSVTLADYETKKIPFSSAIDVFANNWIAVKSASGNSAEIACWLYGRYNE
jgi:hypothetical protein